MHAAIATPESSRVWHVCVCVIRPASLVRGSARSRATDFHATYSIYSVLKITRSIAYIHSTSLFLLRINFFESTSFVLRGASIWPRPPSRRTNANSERKACQPRERLREEAQSVLRGCTRTGGRHGLQCLAIALGAQHKPTQGAQETQSPGERFERR